MLGGGAHFRDRFHKVFQFPIMLQVNKDLQEIQSHQDRLLLKQQLEWLRTRTNRKRLARLERALVKQVNIAQQRKNINVTKNTQCNGVT